MLGDISVADEIYLVCGYTVTCDVPLMVSVPLCRIGSIWIRDREHCTFSVATVVIV